MLNSLFDSSHLNLFYYFILLSLSKQSQVCVVEVIKKKILFGLMQSGQIRFSIFFFLTKYGLDIYFPDYYSYPHLIMYMHITTKINGYFTLLMCTYVVQWKAMTSRVSTFVIHLGS